MFILNHILLQDHVIPGTYIRPWLYWK